MTTTPEASGDYDLRFYFDPVCPFCWMTSTWVRQVRDAKEYRVEWRFISLRILNKDIDYDAHFPPEYEDGHTAGKKLLRMCAAARETGGNDAVDRLYETLGNQVWETQPTDWQQQIDRLAEWAGPLLEDAGLDPSWVDAIDEDRWDAQLEAETEEALDAAGRDVGTPIIQVDPPDGLAFFGPVISRKPSDEEAAELWDHVIALMRVPGFAELKRSLRELPQLRGLGVEDDEVGETEDWHGGSRRLKSERDD